MSGTDAPAGQAADSSPPPLQEVLVTGTLIHGEAPTGSSLVTISHDAIEATGAATVNDVLATVRESGRPLAQADGIASSGQRGTTVVLETGSGRYRFSHSSSDP